MTSPILKAGLKAGAIVDIPETELGLPKFSEIDTKSIPSELASAIDQAKARIDQLAAEPNPTWDSLMVPMEELDDQLTRYWSPISHMNSVVNSDALREAYEACLPLLSDYSSWMGQHKPLFEAVSQLKQSKGFEQLTQAQKQTIEHQLRDFTLSGIGLSEEKQTRFAEVQSRLSELSNQFKNQLLDATNAWSKHIEDKHQLVGIPDSSMAFLAQQASQKELDGWLITLDFPSYLPVMTYCENRALRQELYEAFVTRASDQGPHGGQFDNSQVMDEILALRLEKAQLLGMNNFSELSIAKKMAASTDQVMEFLTDLASKSKPQAEQEFAQLQAFAGKFSDEPLQPWDIAFYGEKLKLAEYDFSQEAVRPYFPVPRVLTGMFEVVNRLFNIDVAEVVAFDHYHQDARLFNISQNGELIARFYLDLYAREKKRGGAWMDECRVRRVDANGSQQIPVAYLVCNFTPPVGDQPSLLTHDEVTTLFHEFGHGIHHMLTQVNVAAVSGINGVEWDAVELPSQFLENWCWQVEALGFISGHVETGEPLPKALLDKMLAAKNFQSAMAMVRQLEFSLFDFRMHMEYRPDSGSDYIQAILNNVRNQVAVVPQVEFNRFQHGFSHIFGGGYAAGYYSYKWAEVLSSDAFSKFEDEGIFNPETGKHFLQNILQKGGSENAEELFEKFMGRKPRVDALLRHSGISGNAPGDAA